MANDRNRKDGFDLFPKLPPELRSMVAKEISHGKPQIFTYRKGKKTDENVFAPTSRGIPPVLRTNRELRKEGGRYYEPLNYYRDSATVPVSPPLNFNRETDFLFLDNTDIRNFYGPNAEVSPDVLAEIRQFKNVCLDSAHSSPRLQDDEFSNLRRHLFSHFFPELKTVLVFCRYHGFGAPKYEELKEIDRVSGRRNVDEHKEGEWKRAVLADYGNGTPPVVKVMIMP